MSELTKLLFSMKGGFTNVVSRWPESTHDSQVFRMSNICKILIVTSMMEFFLGIEVMHLALS